MKFKYRPWCLFCDRARQHHCKCGGCLSRLSMNKGYICTECDKEYSMDWNGLEPEDYQDSS